ncbi:MAG: hypothetical protein N2314_03235 [Brevinematales bacterium]|nr:hypothetical protein [Brevinematales bacterium]
MIRRLFVVFLMVGVFLSMEGCLRGVQSTDRYESLVWTNAWVQLRKRELALPLEIRRVRLFLDIHPSLEGKRMSVQDALVRNLLVFHRMIDNDYPEAEIRVSLFALRHQMVGLDRQIYEMRGSFDVRIGTSPFRSNVIVFDRVYVTTNFPEEGIFSFLLSRWSQYLCEDIHYGWSVSQDFATIPFLGGTNEADVSFPWTK